MSSQTTPETPNAAPGFAMRGQYVKDLSFENPLAPQSLMGNVQPTIEVNVDIKVQKLDANVYEMTLHLAARATAEQKTLFLVDLAHAGVFQLNNIPQEAIEQVILVDCPFVLFPFSRRIIADVTRDGGFAPLMLDPIDFHSLFAQSRANAA